MMHGGSDSDVRESRATVGAELQYSGLGVGGWGGAYILVTIRRYMPSGYGKIEAAVVFYG